MIAAASAIDEQKRQEVRDRENKRFGWESQEKEASLTNLEQRTTAERERLALEQARSAAGRELVPGQTANAQIQQQIDASGLDATLKRQPTANQTADLTAQAGLSNAKTGAAAAKFGEDNIAAELESRAVKGQLDSQGQADAVMSRLATIFDDNDPRRALEFFNAVSSKSKLIPGTNGKRAVDVQVANGSDNFGSGPGYRITLEDGTDMFLTHQSMKNSRQRMSEKPEYQFLQDNDTGQIVAANKRTGTVGVVVEGDSSQRRPKDNRPAEIRLAEYYMSKGVPEDEALRRASSLKNMSPANAAFQLYKDRIAFMPNADEATKEKLRKEVEREVQGIFGGSGAAPQPATPGAQPQRRGPANPEIQRLITRPGGGAGLSQAPTFTRP